MRNCSSRLNFAWPVELGGIDIVLHSAFRLRLEVQRCAWQSTLLPLPPKGEGVGRESGSRIPRARKPNPDKISGCSIGAAESSRGAAHLGNLAKVRNHARDADNVILLRREFPFEAFKCGQAQKCTRGEDIAPDHHPHPGTMKHA